MCVCVCVCVCVCGVCVCVCVCGVCVCVVCVCTRQCVWCVCVCGNVCGNVCVCVCVDMCRLDAKLRARLEKEHIPIQHLPGRPVGWRGQVIEVLGQSVQKRYVCHAANTQDAASACAHDTEYVRMLALTW